jgi:hypothetical protein
MDLSAYQQMDANILLGIVNEKLRIECADLGELLLQYDMAQDQLSKRMSSIGYHYDEMTNQFKANH